MLRVFNRSLFLALFLLISVFAHAQESAWYEDFYVEASFLHYFTPKILDGLVQPKAGFRGSLGYEFKHIRFTVESGYSAIEGTNPLVTDIRITPLLFKVGYAYPIRWGLGVQADLGAGFLFSRVTRYETAIDMVFDNKQNDSVRSPLFSARAYGTYSPATKVAWDFLKFYAGGGADMVMETDGPIPLPLIEVGVSFKPVMLIARHKRAKTAGTEEPYQGVEQ